MEVAVNRRIQLSKSIRVSISLKPACLVSDTSVAHEPYKCCSRGTQVLFRNYTSVSHIRNLLNKYHILTSRKNRVTFVLQNWKKSVIGIFGQQNEREIKVKGIKKAKQKSY